MERDEIMRRQDAMRLLPAHEREARIAEGGPTVVDGRSRFRCRVRRSDEDCA